MRVHPFPEDALSMELPCFMCHLEHRNCALDDCTKPHIHVLTDEEYATLVRTGSLQNQAKSTGKGKNR